VLTIAFTICTNWRQTSPAALAPEPVRALPPQLAGRRAGRPSIPPTGAAGNGDRLQLGETSTGADKHSSTSPLPPDGHVRPLNPEASTVPGSVLASQTTSLDSRVAPQKPRPNLVAPSRRCLGERPRNQQVVELVVDHCVDLLPRIDESTSGTLQLPVLSREAGQESTELLRDDASKIRSDNPHAE
jgi:hypothetical protein